jgi:dihydroorotase
MVDVIGSDHAPHALREKEAESVWDVKVGFPGLETIVPLMLTEVHRERISIGDVVRMISVNPTNIFRLKNKGSLEQAKDADFTVIDYDRKYKIDSSKFHSKAKFSPFDGFEVTGKPVKTYVSGQLVFDDDEIVAKPGTGRIIRRE